MVLGNLANRNHFRAHSWLSGPAGLEDQHIWSADDHLHWHFGIYDGVLGDLVCYPCSYHDRRGTPGPNER